MRIYPNTKNIRSRWLKKPIAANGYQTWLVDGASLTRRLQTRYPDFYVEPCHQANGRPMIDEVGMLNMKRSMIAYIREVLLYGQQQPVVFAHSVLPFGSLRGPWRGLGRLGNRPLGAALFKNPRVTRTPLSYKKLTKNHQLYAIAASTLDSAPPYLWARRSVFHLRCAHIMVTEVFLPTILHA